jgi:hypothetical protein
LTAITAARVEVLTAEVRVLIVGSRQVTLSVFRQLDGVKPEQIRPFGRVQAGTRKPDGAWHFIEVVGASPNGILVRSRTWTSQLHCRSYADHIDGICPAHRPLYDPDWRKRRRFTTVAPVYLADPWPDHAWEIEPDVWPEWSALPLIVLAGLR